MALTLLERRLLHTSQVGAEQARTANFTYDPGDDTAYWGHALSERVTIPNSGSGSGTLNPIVDLTTDVFRGVECGGPWGSTQVAADLGNRRVTHLWVFWRVGEIVVTVWLTDEWYELFLNYGQTNEYQKWTAKPSTVLVYRFDPGTGEHVGTYQSTAQLPLNNNIRTDLEQTVEFDSDSGSYNLLGHGDYQTVLDPDAPGVSPRYSAVKLSFSPSAWLPEMTAVTVEDGYSGATNPYNYYAEVNGSYGLALEAYPLDDPFDGYSVGEWDDPDNTFCAVYDRSDSTRLELSTAVEGSFVDTYMHLSHYQGSLLMAVLFVQHGSAGTVYEYALIGADGAVAPSAPLWSGDWGSAGDWVPAYGYPPGVSSFPIAYPELVDGRVVIVNPEDPTDPWTWVTLPPGAPQNGFLSWWLDGDVWRISYDGVMVLAWQVPADKYALWLQNGAAGGFFNTRSKVFQLDPPAGVPPWAPSGFPIDGSGRYRVDTATWEPETGDSLTEHGIRYRGFDVLLFDDRAEVGELFQDRYILTANRAYRFARVTEPFLVDASEAQMIYDAGYGWACYPVPGGE